MTLTELSKAPFPWFGGKRKAAPTVWQLLGDVLHYVEPFAGTLAVLLERPHPCNRTYYSETVNDADGFICLDPATRVLDADLRWRPIGDIAVGERLIGFDEHNRCTERATVRLSDPSDKVYSRIPYLVGGGRVG